MSDRYKVVPGSTSQHCCFDFSVIVSKPREVREYWGDDGVDTMCECFDEAAAKKIAAALNALGDHEPED